MATPNELMEGAKCFYCGLDKKGMLAVQTYLLSIIAEGGGGGGQTQVFSGNYGGGSPTQTPTTSAAIAYDLDNPGTFWTWNGSAWE